MDILGALGTLLSGINKGGGSTPQSIPATAPQPQQSPQAIIIPTPVPTPTPRPTLPQGSFSPNRQQQPPQMPIMQLLSGQGDMRGMLRAAAAGMGNMGPTGGDPYLAFARGFGGAQNYYQSKEQAAAAAAASAEEKARADAMAAEKLAYDRSIDSREQARSDADLAIRQASEKRLAKSAELAEKKTMAEIQRDAKTSGLTVSQMLEIERVAQAAAEGVYDPEQRKQITDQERQRLIQQVTQGQGITGAVSVSTQGGITAPQAGAVEDGYRFKGGDPSDPSNWEPAG